MKSGPFALVWGGQLVSLLLSSATGISLAIWVFDQTGSTAALATVIATKTAISIYCAPVLGAVADGLPRKTLIVLCDLALAGCSLLLVGATSSLSIGFVGVLAIIALTGLLDALLAVSMAASLRELRADVDLTRANGLVSFVESVPSVAAPLFGAALYASAGLQFVLVLDGCSFLVASVSVMAARWPRPERREAPHRIRSPFAGAARGFRLIFADADLASLQLGFAGINTLTGLGTAAVTAFLLSDADGGELVLGAYNTVGAAGLLVGAAAVAVAGPRLSRSVAVLGGLALAAVGGRLFLGLSHSSVSWIISAGVRSVGVQLSNAPLTAMWQEQTPLDDQGKVFGARRLLGQGTFPIAVWGGGLLSEAILGSFSKGGLAWEIALFGVLEAGVVCLLFCSGTMQRLARRRAAAGGAPRLG